MIFLVEGGDIKLTMDFYRIKATSLRNGGIEITPDFRVCRSKDLMVRGRAFYGIWDEQKGLWSTDEYDVQRLIDEDLRAYTEELKKKSDSPVYAKYMGDFSTNCWTMFKKYVSSISDSNHILDEKVTFADEEVKRSDYVSKRLPYNLSMNEPKAYTELATTLYEPEELQKIEWAIGSIFCGDAKNIQKFIVFYGEAGTGKSTMLNIIQKLFQGYYTTFEAKALASNNNAFSTEVFRGNPLVAIQHDGDLSKIEDNTKINSIVSHEEMTMNEKYKSSYMARINAFLFMGTNKPVKISDAKSGIIRRLIDVKPSGRKLAPKRYDELKNQIDFELGDIANRCIQVYQSLGPYYYNAYRPVDMILQTDVFYNFVEAQYDIFKDDDIVTLSRAYDMYKRYCDESLVDFKLPRYKFREELKNYFEEFENIGRLPDGKQVRSLYSGFLSDKFDIADLLPLKEIGEKASELDIPDWLKLSKQHGLLDDTLRDCPAQYANSNETPCTKWSNVKTKLEDIVTTRVHYVKPPINHIAIDFDLKDESGQKSLDKNIEAARNWPKTYAETSKSGEGLHLHYIYKGDVEKLSNLYSDGIEVKVFTGNSSLRRKLIFCNNEPISEISNGLPLKGDKMVNQKTVEDEKHLRTLIVKNLKKEIHGATKPSVDFIFKLLEDSYNSGMIYDVTDLRPKVFTFASKSTNHSDYCIKLVNKMRFKSEDIAAADNNYKDQRLVFFDCEVFPNLFVVCWKYQGEDTDIMSMINPTASELEDLFKLKLVGFNNRRYDNHILYARYLGYNNEELFKLSQRLINGSNNATFGEAYNLSYTDIYDFSASMRKKSLKKWEIELGIHHQEMEMPWDQAVPEDKWPLVVKYCCNDVEATEAVFNHLKGDFAARQILADLSGLTVNDTTNQHTTKIIFGNEKRPQSEFIYTDLSEQFPGYKYEEGKSTYKGEKVNEGGFVFAIPGMYGNVALLDVESMHPHSIKALKLFGKYTDRFVELMDARLAIKHHDFEKASKMLNGALAKYLKEELIGDLKDALKTAINSVYGLTFTSYDNAFRDIRNVDNIVAKRGALFMVDLKQALEARGCTVVHIKTDSVKIADATKEDIAFVMEFGKKYGYSFEHEATYEKMCIVNDAVYIAKYKNDQNCQRMYGYIPEKNAKKPDQWTATGAQFAQPYVFKTLFSREEILFEDKQETKSVKSSMYLDFNEGLPETEHNYKFVGRVGAFCPMVSGCGAAELFREQDGKYYSVTGTKGYRWMEAETVKELGMEDKIDISYYRQLVDDAIADISKYGNFEMFMCDDPYCPDSLITPPCYPCGEAYESCQDCPYFYGIGTDGHKRSEEEGHCGKDEWSCDDKESGCYWANNCLTCDNFDIQTNTCKKNNKKFTNIHKSQRFPF